MHGDLSRVADGVRCTILRHTILRHTILTCLIILHKHNSPAMCYHTCRPILYPPNHGMFYSCNYIIHWLTDH